MCSIINVAKSFHKHTEKTMLILFRLGVIGRSRDRSNGLGVASEYHSRGNSAGRSDDESLSIDALRDVCATGPGHFLGHGQASGLMDKGYVYPDIGDRGRPGPRKWLEQGSTDALERAHKRVGAILRGYYPAHMSEAKDTQRRAMLVIELPRNNMRAGSNRWRTEIGSKIPKSPAGSGARKDSEGQ